MKLAKLLNTYTLTLSIVALVYFFYVSVFIKPWRFENFSMVDDGQVLLQSASYFKSCFKDFDCALFIDQTFEFGSARFRPSYWIINNLNFEVFKFNPVSYHVFRAYVIGSLIVLLLSHILLRKNVTAPVVIIVAAMFISTPSFAENIVRLGTNEPYQVLFIAMLSIMYLKKKSINDFSSQNFLFTILLLTWILLIKENDIAIVFAILLTELILNKFKLNHLNRRSYLILVVPTAIFLLGMVITSLLPSQISLNIPEYTSNYVTSLPIIFNNLISIVGIFLNSMSPLLKASILLIPILYIVKKAKYLFLSKDFIFWSLVTILFTGMLLPWRHVLDRYHLVGIFSATIVVALILNEVIKYLELYSKQNLGNGKFKFVFIKLFIIFVLINLLFSGLPLNLAKSINYANWFSQFTKFEGDQMMSLSKYKDSEILINAVNNISDWEYLYEIPIHQKFIYSKDFNVRLFEREIPRSGYILSRSPLDLEATTVKKELINVVESQKYVVSQIDPIAFRNDFRMRPITTFFNPPLMSEELIYYWEIIKVK